MKIGIGIIGLGYWGPNLVRNFAASPLFEVVAIADRSEERLDNVRPLVPSARLVHDGADLIADNGMDAVAIATPVGSHAALCKLALESGKHVWVEKPLCSRVAEGEELVALARKNGGTLFVDHTFLFTGAVQEIKQQIVSGKLGKISYYDSLRVNLGLFQPDVNVLWDLAPHDFSIMDYLLGGTPRHVEATGFCHVNQHLADITYVTAHFDSFIAHFNLSWMSPVKVRRIAIGGSERMIVWDDLNREEKIKVYSSGIRFQPEQARGTIIPDYRIGDIWSPRVSNREALSAAVDHFANVIIGKEVSIMSGEHGLRVMRLLEWSQRALDDSLAKAREHQA